MALVLTGVFLLRIDYLHRSVVEPGHPEYLSNYVEARGAPFAWLVVEPEASIGPTGLKERVLPGPLVRDVVFWWIAVVVVGLFWRWRRRRVEIDRRT